MLPALTKVFVQAFYKANAGFFLFFFFVFFGSVQGGTLIGYHLSLIKSMLGSTTILLLVLACWTAYHAKCTSFFLKFINSAEGRFLYNLQAMRKSRQWFVYATLYINVYLPVLLYAIVVAIVGWQKNYLLPSLFILLYQIASIGAFTWIIYYRLNNWIKNFRFPTLSWPLRKTYLLYVLFSFIYAKNNPLLLLKVFSLLLLYLALIWNGGPFSNDAFILFYLLLLAAHAVLPYLSVRFTENQMAFARNLPVTVFKRGLAFLIPYCLIVLPESLYLFLAPNAMPVFFKLAYVINVPAFLMLLTAVQYSETQSRDEYLKATGGLLFVSLFVFHVQAFWLWIAVQVCIAALLFANGYYKFERSEEE